MPICDENLQIIYRNKKPYGIRDKGGYLFFFSGVSKYEGQEERYRQEIDKLNKLADYLLKALKDEQDLHQIEAIKEEEKQEEILENSQFGPGA